MIRNIFKKRKEEEKYIGEVLVKGIRRYPGWERFKESDYDRNGDHDGYLKIFGKCHKREFVIFYDDVYKPLRKQSEKLLYKK